MKKLLLTFATGALLLGASSANAETVTITFGKTGWEPAFPTTAPTNPSTAEYTKDGITITGYDVRSTSQGSESKGTYTEAIILTKNSGYIILPAFSKPIETISLYSHNGASTSAKITIEGTAEETAPVIALTAANVTDAYSHTFNPIVAENTRLTLKAGANNVQLSKVVLTLKDNDVRLTPTFEYAQTEYTANYGEEFATPYLMNPLNLPATWSSSDETVATVADNGDVTIVAAGTTVITATFAGNEEYKPAKAEYTLTVVDNREIPTLSFPEDEYTAVLEADFESPVLNNPSNVEVVWSSSDEAVATVDQNGIVEITGAGNTVISAVFAGNNQYQPNAAEYTIVVTDPNAPIVMAVEFDFTSGNTMFDKTPSNQSSDPYFEGSETKAPITISVKGARYWGNADSATLRLYSAQSSEVTISASEDFVLGDISFAGSNIYLGTTTGTIEGNQATARTWAPGSKNIKSVTFTAEQNNNKNNTSTFNTITVNYDKATSVSTIGADDEGEAVYFDLTGRRISEPAKGMFIRVQGGKATKVVK